MVTGIEKLGLAIMVFVLMFGMGATLTWADFSRSLKHPKAIIIGFLSQFGIMPALAFVLAKVFALPDTVALSLILVGCTPGGTTSNLFSYYAKGDVALSISMTTASTIGAVFMMPMLLLVYGSAYGHTKFPLPYGNIASSLVIMLIPVIIGMYVRKKSHRAAQTCEKIGSWAGSLVIIFLLVQFFLRDNQTLKEASFSIFATAILLGVIGFVLGYGAAFFTGLTPKQSRTVSLETGIQNTPLTIALILATFPLTEQREALLLPILYAVFIVIDSLLASLLFRRMARNERVNE
ncbi:MAG: Pantothenate precursors transporter PanS [Turneriella sp.]|nr:Pantothenate precursors transporter PanS [Turneriella sp.]